MKDFKKRIGEAILGMHSTHAIGFIIMFVLSIILLFKSGLIEGGSLFLLVVLTLFIYLFDKRGADTIIKATCVDVIRPQLGFITTSNMYVFQANDQTIKLQIAGKKLRIGCEYKLYFNNKSKLDKYSNTNFIRAEIVKIIFEERKAG